MAQAEPITLTLENISDVRQWIVVDDQEHSIPEYGILDFPEDIASVFLAERPRWVREYQPTPLPAPNPGEAIVYLANMTGSPFHPPTVTLTLWRRGKEVDETHPNPLRSPRVITHTMIGGSVVQQCRNDPTSMESINLPPVTVTLPPFRRFRLGTAFADWLLKRDMAQLPQLSGQIALVREPRDFEAQRYWPLLDLQIYAEYLDRNSFNARDERFGELMAKSEKDYATEEELRAARDQLWTAVWFRSLDERFYHCSAAELRRRRTLHGSTPASRSEASDGKKSLAEQLKEGGKALAV